MTFKFYIPARRVSYATSEPPPGRPTFTQLPEVPQENEARNGGTDLLGTGEWATGHPNEFQASEVPNAQQKLKDEVRGVLYNPEIDRLINLPEFSIEGETEQRNDVFHTPDPFRGPNQEFPALNMVQTEPFGLGDGEGIQEVSGNSDISEFFDAPPESGSGTPPLILNHDSSSGSGSPQTTPALSSISFPPASSMPPWQTLYNGQRQLSPEIRVPGTPCSPFNIWSPLSKEWSGGRGFGL